MLNRLRLLTPGPTPLPEEVRLALAKDMVHHRKPHFKSLMLEIQEGLQMIFGTKQPVLPLTCSGSGAMTAAVTNCFSPGESVLVIEGGKFAERWSEIALAHGLNVRIMPVEWGRAVNPDQMEAALSEDPQLRGVLVQASETSTGVLHPIEKLGKITAPRDVMLLVDGISAVGVSPCPMDAWSIDCLITGSQKGLMLPPGLAFIALSPRAWERVEKNGRQNFYFDLLAERENARSGQTLFTPAINLLVGLKAALDLFHCEGLDNIFRRQWALVSMVRAAVSAMGMTLFARDHFAWGLTSILVPDGLSAKAILKTAENEYGVIMAAGQGHMKDSIIRFGHMGYVDFGDITAGLYALAQSWRACGGYIGSRDFLEQGLRAYEESLKAGNFNMLEAAI